jgi:hypothetical protein
MSKPRFLRSGALAHLRAAGMHIWLVGRHLSAAVRVVLGHGLAAVLAVGVVFMEWGWRPLAAWLGRFSSLRPIAAFEAWLRRLPPYGALVMFGLPSVLILPLKLLALYLISSGFKVAAAALFIGAKVIGTAIVARIYLLTETALMQIPWFKRVYDLFMPYKTTLTAWVRESYVWRYGRVLKARIKQRAAPYLAAVKSAVAALRLRLFGR